jgi:stathmin
MYEAKKAADWTNKMAKIEEASRKKDELNNEFMNQTKETLICKMEQSEEKREAIMSDMVEKLKVGFNYIHTHIATAVAKSNFLFYSHFSIPSYTQNHTDEIRRSKEMMEQQKVEERNALNDKLKAAANLRDENIKRILSRLREHVSCHLHSFL